MKKQRCGNCRHGALNESDDESIVCHRYPPTITKVEEGRITSHFPLVHITAWCGEWMGKPVH